MTGRRARGPGTYDRRLCGDADAYGMWAQDFPAYKDKPIAVGRAAYQEWLTGQPPCGQQVPPTRQRRPCPHLRTEGGDQHEGTGPTAQTQRTPALAGH